MKTNFFNTLIVLLIFISTQSKAQLYVSKDLKLSFFSETAMENIEATDDKEQLIFSQSSQSVQIRLRLRNFKFPSSFMEEHFNDNFVESDKYPYSLFMGKVNEKINLKENGTYSVTVTGDLDLHGVKKSITFPVSITVKDGKISFTGKFKVKLADYKIEDPSIIGTKVAEEVEVRMNGQLEEKPAKTK